MSKIKSIIIAFELPKLDDVIDYPSLNKKIFNKYLYYLDVLKSEFSVLKLENGNKILLFEMIARFTEVIMANKDKESEFEKMKESIESLIEFELGFNNLTYKKL